MNSKSKKITFFIFMLLGLTAFTHFAIGFQHVPYHVQDLLRNLGFSKSNPAQNTQTAGADKGPINGLNTALDASKVSYKHPNITYPYDTTMYILASLREKEMQIIKESNFEQLALAKNPPSVQEVIAALMDSYPYLMHYWANENLRLELGTCYQSKFKNSDNCVSAMIVLYDSETNKESNSEGVLMMESAYDFFQYPDGRWVAKHISQNIPFDYELHKKYR